AEPRQSWPSPSIASRPHAFQPEGFARGREAIEGDGQLCLGSAFSEAERCLERRMEAVAARSCRMEGDFGGGKPPHRGRRQIPTPTKGAATEPPFGDAGERLVLGRREINRISHCH